MGSSSIDIPTLGLPVSGDFLTASAPHSHVVQLYGSDDQMLARNVAQYLRSGAQNGDSLIVIATQEHLEAFRHELSALGVAVSSLQNDDRLVLLDADRTLAAFMMDGKPDAGLFDREVGDKIRALRAKSAAGVRAYGEMVGILWTRGYFMAAMQLEDLWNDLMATAEFRLYCSYPIDIFGDAFHACDAEAVLCSHSHFVAADTRLEEAILRSIHEVLGSAAAALTDRLRQNLSAPAGAPLRAESISLWLRRHLPGPAEAILTLARSYSASLTPIT